MAAWACTAITQGLTPHDTSGPSGAFQMGGWGHSRGEVSSPNIHWSALLHAGVLPTFSMASGSSCVDWVLVAVLCAPATDPIAANSSGTHQAPGFRVCSTETDHREGIC